MLSLRTINARSFYRATRATVTWNCYYHNTIRNMKFVKLSHTGDFMPTLGLGTWQAEPHVLKFAVSTALELGYRHIDTAFNYNNEEAIGSAISEWIDAGKGVRSDLFITTKLPHVGNRASDVEKFLDIQLKRLQTSYVDLYLIHVPFGFKCDEATLTPKVGADGSYELDMDTDHIAIWKKLEECQEAGLIRNIGLSNFNEEQIYEIMKSARVKPQVLQVELHTYFQQNDLRNFCMENDIVLTAYAPLGSPGAKTHFVTKYKYSPSVFPDLMQVPEVLTMAKKYGKTPAQILLHFLVQQKIVVIPKSTNTSRIKENMDLYDFELTQDDMHTLYRLDKGEKGRIFNFLFWKGVENHPEYPFKQVKEKISAENI
nr:1,5-anhydro-D-fructose reductase [Helicoverpa armigera]